MKKICSVLFVLGFVLSVHAGPWTSTQSVRLNVDSTALSGVVITMSLGGDSSVDVSSSALLLSDCAVGELRRPDGRSYPTVAVSEIGFTILEGLGSRLRVPSDSFVYFDADSDRFEILGGGFSLKMLEDKAELERVVGAMWRIRKAAQPGATDNPDDA